MSYMNIFIYDIYIYDIYISYIYDIYIYIYMIYEYIYIIYHIKIALDSKIRIGIYDTVRLLFQHGILFKFK